MAAATSSDAQIPAALALAKLSFSFAFEMLHKLPVVCSTNLCRFISCCILKLHIKINILNCFMALKSFVRLFRKCFQFCYHLFFALNSYEASLASSRSSQMVLRNQEL